MASAYVVRGRKVLLVHHRKIDLWLPAGGHLEPGETPPEAALREVREETGLAVDFLEAPDRFGNGEGVRVLPRPHHVQVERIAEGPHEHIDFVYVCRVRSGRVRKNPESNEVRWFSTQDLRTTPKVDRNVRHFGSLAIAQYGSGGST